MEQKRFSRRNAYNDFLKALEVLSLNKRDEEALKSFPGLGPLKEFLLPLEDKSQWTENDLQVYDNVRVAHELIEKIFPGQYKKAIDSIKSSMLTSFYTPPSLIRSMIEPLVPFLQGHDILDPSAGNGLFLEELAAIGEKYDITAIEKDLLTAKVLETLYPDVTVINSGFEDYKSAGSFDLVTSNIPFGQISVYDPWIYKEAIPIKVKATTRIHNFFAVKGLDNLKEGGLMAYVVSSGLMDSPANTELRKYLVSKANFVEALRLPNTAFQAVGTFPVTDVIVLQKDTAKKNRLTPNDKLFIESNLVQIESKEISMNAYYGHHQDRILGKLVLGGQYSDDALNVEPIEGKDYLIDLKTQLGNSMTGLTRKARIIGMDTVLPPSLRVIPDRYPNRSLLKEGNLVTLGVESGTVTFVDSKLVFKAIPSLRDYQRVNQISQIRDLASALLQAEVNSDSEQMKKLRADLNGAYDQFTFSYGFLNSPQNRRVLSCDVEGFKLLSLERLDGKDNFIKSDIFHRQVNNVEKQVSAATVQDAVVLSLNSYNRIDIGLIAELLGRTENEVVIEGLRSNQFYFEVDEIRDSYRFVTEDEFLSGDIVRKLELFDTLQKARYPFMRNDEWDDHFIKLEAVRPAFLPRNLIDINMGVNWVPLDIYKSFAEKIFECDLDVKYLGSTNDYLLDLQGDSNFNDVTLAATTANGTIVGKYIWEYAMQDQLPRLTIRIDEDTVIPDITGMKNVAAKVNQVKKMWGEYTTNNKAVAKRLEDIYNHDINNLVPRKYNGAHLTFPELELYDPKWNQRDAVWKVLQDDGGLCDHVVGAGKTLIIVLAAMRMRQLGLCKKPLILCLKSNVGAIVTAFKECYPNANVLAPSEKDFTPQKRKAIFSSIMTNDWDAVIMTHENFQRIPQAPEIVNALDQDEIDNLERDLDSIKGDEPVSKRVRKGLEKRKANLSVKMKEREASTERDDHVTNFQTMGFDHLFVDESHEFKNLPFTTRQSNVSGLGVPAGSGRARNLLQAVRTIQWKKEADKGITFLSGTPISNSLVELYLLKKYLRPTKLGDSKLNLVSFDAWAKMFAKKSSTFEFTITGEVKSKTRYREFINLPELSMWYKEMSHVIVSRDLQADRPTLDHVMVNMEPTQAQKDFIEQLIMFTNTKDGSYIGLPMMSDSEKQAYMLIATNLAKKMSMDMRMIDSSLPRDENSKIPTLCSIVADEYRDSAEYKGTQLIFSDLGTPGGSSFNVYAEIKKILVSQYGIPTEEIAFVHDYNTKAKAKAFEDKLNTGDIRIALGSTKKLGTGKNVQKRIIALHQIDVPWTPKDIEQREGRGGRQGADMAKLHRNNVVKSYFYAVNRTLDAYQFNVVSNKQKFIEQVKTNARLRKLDEGAMDSEGGMNYNEYVALLSGNQDLLKKAQLDKKISALEQDWKAFQAQQQDNLSKKSYELKRLTQDKEVVANLKLDLAAMNLVDMETVPVAISGTKHLDKKVIGEALLKSVSTVSSFGSVVIAKQGVFNLHCERDVSHYESGRAIYVNKVRVVSDNGSVFLYADGLLNKNPALAGRYILDSIRRTATVIESAEGRITTREGKIRAYEEELTKVFTAHDELLSLQRELKEVEDRLSSLGDNNKIEGESKTQAKEPVAKQRPRFKIG